MSDFMTETKKIVEGQRKRIAGLNEEISTLDTEIKSLQKKIDSYTDVSDVKTYSDLKNNLEVRKNKRKVLQNELASVRSAQDEKWIADLIKGFSTEKRRIDNEAADNMLSAIMDLQNELDDVTERRESLKSLYDSWVTAFGIPIHKYEGYPAGDETSVIIAVARLISSLQNAGKL